MSGIPIPESGPPPEENHTREWRNQPDPRTREYPVFIVIHDLKMTIKYYRVVDAEVWGPYESREEMREDMGF